MCNIIAVLNPKGGSGKTTTAVNVARALSMIKVNGKTANVVLVDTDPQGSALDWADHSEADFFTVVGANKHKDMNNPKGLRNVVQGLAASCDWMVIDGAGTHAVMAAETMKLSDLVIIPVQPSPLDFWACASLVEDIKTRQQITDGHPTAAFQVTCAKKGTRLARAIVDDAEQYGLPILNGSIHHRTVFAQSMNEGLTVLDVDPKGDAACEINRLAKQIIGAFE